MSMMKKSFILLAAAATLFGTVSISSAEILPPHGPGQQIGASAVVLCESLTVRREPDASSEAAETLSGGDRVMVMDMEDGWAHIATSDAVDAEPPGYVNEDYLAIDPAWYVTDDSTVVYAFDDVNAPRVALLDPGTRLPILKDKGDWVVVGVHGASGWIPKTDEDYEYTGGQDEDSEWFTVYAEDGSTADIRLSDGSMYEDADGRTYSNIRGDIYYCITTDVTYAADPDIWTNGEPTPDE